MALLLGRSVRRHFNSRGRVQIFIWLITWLFAAWLIQAILDWLGFANFGSQNQRGFEVATLGYLFLLQIWAIASGAQLIQKDISSGSLDWYITKPISKSSLTLATYIGESIWFGALTIGIGTVAYIAAKASGLAAMNSTQALTVFFVAWINMVFWLVFTSAIATVSNSTKIGMFMSFVLVIANGGLQTIAISMSWLALSPTLLFSKLEPLMLGNIQLDQLVTNILVAIATFGLAVIATSKSLQRHYR